MTHLFRFKDKFHSQFELKVQIWPKVRPKISKIASQSMNTFKDLQAVEKAVFSSHRIGLHLRKMKMYLINLVGAYVGDNGKIYSKHRLLSKQINFFQLKAYLMTLIFQFLEDVRVSVQIFMLGSRAIAKLQVFGHSR